MIRLAERELKTKYGLFTEILYYDGQCEAIALVVGDVQEGEEVLCRIHSACIGGHVFNSVECECADEMADAQQAIADAGKGVVVYLDQEGKGNGHLALMLSAPFKRSGMSQAEAYVAAGFSADARDYRSAAGVLNDLGVASVALMSNDRKKADELARFGIEVRLIGR